MLRFVDTRTGMNSDKTFSEVVLKGIAESGGLFVPERLPQLTAAELEELGSLPYKEAAARVFSRFELDFYDEEIASISAAAYGTNFDDERIIPLEKIRDGVYSLELWHGPTSAFKDMALQCMPLFFSAAYRKRRELSENTNEMQILVATSGDTGKAALDGFAGREGVRICVLYPNEGVSMVQRLQMATQSGEGVEVLGVEGNFDDCQTLVKKLFTDEQFKEELETEKGLELSSANSINFGRLLPQVVYYLVAPLRMRKTGQIGEDELVDVVVPTGNFGNILAAYYAKLMGAPIGRLICASNENNVLSDFINTGVYDIRNREFFTTPSPSMDILISSNLERFLYHLAGAEKTASWMKSLMSEGYFKVDDEVREALGREMLAGFASNNESLENIKKVYEETGYLMEPHTSVAEMVGMKHKGSNPLLIASTAHWAKFGSDVLRALKGMKDAEDFGSDYEGKNEFDLLREVATLAPSAPGIPPQIADLEGMEPRFTRVINADEDELSTILLQS